jgi:hypothetical protein
MNVILSGAKEPTVGMRVYCNRLNIDEAKMMHGSLKILAANKRSLASLGMTNNGAKDFTN